MKNETCIFCKIIAREIPSTVVYEDDRFIAFLSIAPRSPGHTLVVPKEHHRWVWDVPQFDECFALARRIALAQRKAFGQDLICSHVEGEEVPHAHIWVYPDVTTAGDKKDFVGNAKRIIEKL
ncbi:MAG: histidine triad protein Hit-like protein involved in cell-cycle regulation [Candidatus Taylorbacteria bacterium]|nr:histidine triad protein Hit-like protein involved in cell-cycle regulation [Candidatus Taylorbacteria bacterium]